MQNNEYVTLLRQLKSVSIASVDEFNNPHVRIIDIMFVEDNKLFFVTARGKNFHKNLTHNPKVAITALTKDYKMLKINGDVKKLGREHLDRVFEENPMMNEIYPDKSRYILDVFCVYTGNGEFFDISVVPPTHKAFGIGDSVGYIERPFINDNCIDCGTCADSCPTSCIAEGSPYVVDYTLCLNCGLCIEECPSEAIELREYSE